MTDKGRSHSAKLVKSAARVADILEHLATERGDRTITDISTRLGIPKSSSHGLLSTLSQKNIVSRDERGNYSLSVAFLALAGQAFGLLDIRKTAEPIMQNLSQRFDATVNLAVLDGSHVVYVEKVQPPTQRTIQLVTFVGGSLPAHATALGKALIAQLPDDAQRQWLESHDYTQVTPKTLSSAAALRNELDQVLEQGYAIDDEESHPGVLCIAAPVFDHSGLAVAAISLTGIHRHLLNQDPTPLKGLGNAVRHSADQLSQLLGFKQIESTK